MKKDIQASTHTNSALQHMQICKLCNNESPEILVQQACMFYTELCEVEPGVFLDDEDTICGEILWEGDCQSSF